MAVRRAVAVCSAVQHSPRNEVRDMSTVSGQSMTATAAAGQGQRQAGTACEPAKWMSYGALTLDKDHQDASRGCIAKTPGS